MTREEHKGLYVLGLFMALGLSVAGYFIGQTLYNAKVALNVAEVKGLAERRVTADLANWQIVYKVKGERREDIPALYRLAEEQQRMIADLLLQGGFSAEEIRQGVLNYEYLEYRDESQRLVDQAHTLVGNISVETRQVGLVAKVRASVNTLIAKGLYIENQDPVYRFTRLNEIKPDMLREATQNARIAANEFAENAGVTVGGIRSAVQGSFFVRDAGEEYGDTAKIDKDVRVVTTITFYLSPSS